MDVIVQQMETSALVHNSHLDTPTPHIQTCLFSSLIQNYISFLAKGHIIPESLFKCQMASSWQILILHHLTEQVVAHQTQIITLIIMLIVLIITLMVLEGDGVRMQDMGCFMTVKK